MDNGNLLAERFEAHRPHLRAVAYRMLGSLTEAEDAVQEAWLRLSRTDVSTVDNLAGWLTTVVGRICLDMLRSRTSRREESLEVHLPDPVVSPEGAALDPEQEALLADAVGLAMLVVLDTLAPAERLAFVLHDMFGVPFDEIAEVLGRSPDATRQLASRGRRRVQGSAAVPDADLARQREVVNAFFAAARDGDFEALLTVLDPEVVLRDDRGTAPDSGSRLLRGARTVATEAATWRGARWARPAMVNGTAGVVIATEGRTYSVIGLTVRDGRITTIDVMADQFRIRGMDLSFVTNYS